MTTDEMLVLRYGSVRGDGFDGKVRTARTGMRLLARGLFCATGDGCVAVTEFGKTSLRLHALEHPHPCLRAGTEE